MKKTIIISFVCLAVAMFAGYNVYLSNVKTKGLSDLALANVEALAVGDYIPGTGCGEEVEYKTKFTNYDGSFRVTFQYKCIGLMTGSCLKGKYIEYYGTQGQYIGAEDLRVKLYCI